jgi:hypothetical protein
MRVMARATIVMSFVIGLLLILSAPIAVPASDVRETTTFRSDTTMIGAASNLFLRVCDRRHKSELYLSIPVRECDLFQSIGINSGVAWSG